MEIDMTEINAVLRDAVHRSAQQVSVCADEEQSSVVFTGITPLVETQGCIGFSETLVVIVVFPERPVEKRKDDVDSFAQRGLLGERLLDCFMVADNASFDAFFKPRTAMQLAASILAFGAVPAVHILR